MKKNIHFFGRAFRVIAGAALVTMAFVGPANPWFLLGVVPLATGLMGWCPPFAVFRAVSCRLESKK